MCILNRFLKRPKKNDKNMALGHTWWKCVLHNFDQIFAYQKILFSSSKIQTNKSLGFVNYPFPFTKDSSIKWFFVLVFFFEPKINLLFRNQKNSEFFHSSSTWSYWLFSFSFGSDLFLLLLFQINLFFLGELSISAASFLFLVVSKKAIPKKMTKNSHFFTFWIKKNKQTNAQSYIVCRITIVSKINWRCCCWICLFFKFRFHPFLFCRVWLFKFSKIFIFFVACCLVGYFQIYFHHHHLMVIIIMTFKWWWWPMG